MKREPSIYLWYCKTNKKTGDPIIVKDMDLGHTFSTDQIAFKNVDIVMKFNNAIPEAKRSGATTILQVYRNTQNIKD